MRSGRLSRVRVGCAVIAFLAGGCGDGGEGPGDAGVEARDAQVALDAGGEPALDAGGEPAVDAGGGEQDAGTGGADAGTPGADAGMMTAASDPTMPGPFAVSAATTAMVMRGTRSTPVTAHVPAVPAGTRVPLVVFFPGFQTNSSMYAMLCERVASHGFVVVRADPSASFLTIDHTAMAMDGQAVIDWALGPSSPLASVVDAERVAVMGHSLGGKVSTMVAFADRRVDALLPIDPVNGGNPFSGYSMSLPDIVPDQVTPLTIPVGFLGETTNGAGGGFMPACAPTDQNFQTFYAAATGAPWAAQFDFTGADHLDFLDGAAGGLAGGACPNGTADQATVAAGTRTLAVAFFRRHLRSETSMDAYLFGASVPAGVVVMHR